MNEENKKTTKESKRILLVAAGAAIGVGVMLLFRRYEMKCIGRGIAQVVLDPEKLTKVQDMATAINQMQTAAKAAKSIMRI